MLTLRWRIKYYFLSQVLRVSPPRFTVLLHDPGNTFETRISTVSAWVVRLNVSASKCRSLNMSNKCRSVDTNVLCMRINSILGWVDDDLWMFCITLGYCAAICTYYPQKKDKDRRKCKCRRFCLGVRIFSIPCLGRFGIIGCICTKMIWKKRMNSSFSSKSS